MAASSLTSLRCLVGSAIGSLVGAATLMLLGVLIFDFDKVSTSPWTFLSSSAFLALFMLVPFLVIGWPLFLWQRHIGSLSRWPGITLGALVGLAATHLFGDVHLRNGADLAFVGTFVFIGALATAVCATIATRPNPPVNRTRRHVL